MKRIILMAGLLALFALGMTACYQGEVAGPGSVPPPPPPRPDSLPPEKSQWPDQLPGTTAEQALQADIEALAAYKAETLPQFKGAYGSAGNPRIMVFLNRQLSAEVREWATDERAVVQQSGAAMVKTTDAQGNETTQKAAVKQDAQAYVQKHTGVGGDRSGPEEAWMWSFEDGFLAPLLESGAQLVDRTTTMRLVAAGSGKAGSATDLTSVKQVEMDALKGSADMFVEILVTEAPGSAYGYEFKATAKDVKTGLIKANVSSLRWNMKKRMTKEAVVTGKGYDVVEKEAEMPPVHMVSERLSMDMMNALARTWGGGQ